MRKIRIPAVLAAAAIPVCAAAAIITASQAAQASTTYHHPVGPAVVSSYSCTPYVTGYDRHGHPLMGKDCMVNVIFTGPSGAWTLYIQTPRREKLTDFAWQANDSSEMGSTAPQTKYAPLTVSGYPDDYATGILPAGEMASGWFNFLVPAGERVPTVSIQATR